jgi:hypothetical protein
VDQQQQSLPVHSRSKKTLMKDLRIASDAVAVSPGALDSYASAFSKPLSSSQIRALAALFGWAPPEGLEEPGAVTVC